MCFADDDPPAKEFSGSDASVMERVMRRPSSSMAASVSFLGSICVLLFFVGLLPSLVGLRRLGAFDEISARALEPFDLVDEPMLCPCLLLVIRGMAAEGTNT